MHTPFDLAFSNLNPTDSSSEDFAVMPSVVGGTVVANKTKYSSFVVGLMSPQCYEGKQSFCAVAYIGYNLILTAARKIHKHHESYFSTKGFTTLLVANVSSSLS